MWALWVLWDEKLTKKKIICNLFHISAARAVLLLFNIFRWKLKLDLLFEPIGSLARVSISHLARRRLNLIKIKRKKLIFIYIESWLKRVHHLEMRRRQRNIQKQDLFVFFTLKSCCHEFIIDPIGNCTTPQRERERLQLLLISRSQQALLKYRMENKLLLLSAE